MANIFKSTQAVVNSVAATAYTVPAATTTVVIGMRFGNKTTGDITVEADVDKAGTKSKYVGADTPIPVGSSLEGLGGAKLVLNEGDFVEVVGSADACADLTLSIMEIT